MHAVTTGPLFVNLAVSAVLLCLGKQAVAFFLDMTAADLSSFVALFGLIASTVILTLATRADKIVETRNKCCGGGDNRGNESDENNEREQARQPTFNTQNSSALNILQAKTNSQRHFDFNNVGK